MSKQNFDILVKFKKPEISALMYVRAEDEDGARRRVKTIVWDENPAIEFREIRVGAPLSPVGCEYDFDGRGGLKMPPGAQVESMQLPSFTEIEHWPGVDKMRGDKR